MMLATASLPLCLVVTCRAPPPRMALDDAGAATCRAPPPRMALDDAGAAITIRDLDVWAGSNNLIESFDWRIMPREPATQHVQRAERAAAWSLVRGARSQLASARQVSQGTQPEIQTRPTRIALQLLGLGKHILKL